MTGKFAALTLAAMIAGLVAVNVALYDTPVDIAPIASKKGRDGGLAPGPAGSLQLPDAGDFSETFERPLFSPTRRKFVPEPVTPHPVEVAAAPVEQQPVPPPQNAAPAVAPTLLGISIHRGAAKALLRIAGSDTALWYGKDEIVDGWKVSTIDKDQAALERDGRVARIPLYPSSRQTLAESVGQ
ncbi:conserved exported hypothetical protein [Mesorhizobium metallidurans STM 2683]|uniref:Type II secretion system protein GspC N-terminal domain-containing protein n=1 Tax=Mesorhizobium metallidurans STM 2683 TaxID=1297569 RepID=M5EZA0_9HYPH|nr:hypothetical protein [Mesorhizobium metallidurans]CCV09522.1 conserved exported hypothetical protein [Mesorhizobium metallidurans STM 2683]